MEIYISSKNMKKIVLFAFLILFPLSIYAYTPTIADQNQIKSLKSQINQIATWAKDKRDFYTQLRILKEKFSYNARLSYYLDQIAIDLVDQIHIEKNKVKAENIQFKKDFLSQYMSGISKEITDPDNCTGRYQTLDAMAYANNYPTALLMATWFRESTCGYYLPKNGDGPFQIVSKDYGTGQITEEIFWQAVQDFIDFSRNKYSSYKSRVNINLTYTGFDYTWIISHASLYNGGYYSGGIILPVNPHYVFDGYGEQYSWATRYGLFPKFLKLLEREVNN